MKTSLSAEELIGWRGDLVDDANHFEATVYGYPGMTEAVADEARAIIWERVRIVDELIEEKLSE